MAILAMTTDGRMTYCSAPPEARGIGRCNHMDHQKDGETTEEFVERISNLIEEHEDNSVQAVPDQDQNEISQEQIDKYAKRIDEIAGTHVTPENMDEVFSNLSPEQMNEINSIGFDAAPEFSLNISDEHYGEARDENNLYFSDLANEGIAGKKTSFEQMLVGVGEVPGHNGEHVNIENSYLKGLTPDEYFEKQYSARAAQIAKSVSTALPGYAARKMFYGLSDIEVKSDCGNNSSTGISTCSVPGGICKKCLQKSGVTEYNTGDLIGAHVSTNSSEGLTQVSMKQFHSLLHSQTVFVLEK